MFPFIAERWLPVLVISGFARERDEALELMKDGATDVIQKPDNHAVSQAIRKAFAESRRETHELCENHPVVPQDNFKETVVIAIPFGSAARLRSELKRFTCGQRGRAGTASVPAVRKRRCVPLTVAWAARNTITGTAGARTA